MKEFLIKPSSKGATHFITLHEVRGISGLEFFEAPTGRNLIQGKILASRQGKDLLGLAGDLFVNWYLPGQNRDLQTSH
ncbi:hypothetical protein [Algoriphagus namhaensis]